MTRFLAALLSVLGTVGVSACASAPVAPTTPSAPRALPLWRVADDAGHVAYVMPTIHMLPEDVVVDAAIDRALAQSEALAVEVSPESMQSPAVQSLVMQLGMRAPDEAGLDSELPADAMDKLATLTGKAGVPRMALVRMRPWMAMTLAVVSSLVDAGFDPGSGVEKQLFSMAEKQRKPVWALETAEEQIRLLASLPADEARKSLVELASSNPQKATDELKALVEAWSSGDAAHMDTVLDSIGEKNPATEAFNRAFITNRNDHFSAQLQTWLKEGKRPFVAVGMAHVVGDGGMLAQLRASGLHVEQVRSDDAALAVH